VLAFEGAEFTTCKLYDFQARASDSPMASGNGLCRCSLANQLKPTHGVRFTKGFKLKHNAAHDLMV